MTDLNAKIIPLRTETASLAPTAVQLDVGEIATNLEDGLIYSKKTDGTVVTLGGGGGGGGDLDGLTDVDVSTVAPADGQSLVWDDSNSEWIPGYPSFGIGDGSGLPGGDYEPNTESPNFFRWEYDGYGCTPAAGYAGWCPGGWDLTLNVTDADGLNREGALYALESGDPFRIVLADGTEIFNGLLSGAGNKDSDRITLALDDDPDQEGLGVSSLVDDGDDIYIELTCGGRQ